MVEDIKSDAINTKFKDGVLTVTMPKVEPTAEEKKKIEADEDRLLDEAAAMLELSTSQERLFTVRWILKEDP